MKTTSKKIIIAPLNWGLGHATRCIPIINALLLENFLPIIASDGKALVFLQKEFPSLETIKLPSYHIKYGKNLKWNLLLQTPAILKAVQQEKKIIANFLSLNKEVVGIISDNRFGVRHKKIPSVYITHQINVISGFTTFISSKIHQKIINKFHQCWVPDNKNSQFSGKLSETNTIKQKKYIGVLSRFKKEEIKQNIDVLIIISGPEPNRTFLEQKLTTVFKNNTKNIVFVLGNIENSQKKWKNNNCTFYNYVLSKELQQLLNSAKVVVCRSGYTSILDLAVLGKKVFFIPTENQPEQEYLANYLEKNNLAPFCNVQNFTEERLLETKNYKGLKTRENAIHKDLFSLFHSK